MENVVKENINQLILQSLILEKSNESNLALTLYK
jgi:hypothetical protein